MRRAPLWLVCALAAAPAARAETLYVVEQLVVNVNSAPDASGERIATVKSGERMEVIERLRDQVHVQLPGGKDGWIRASYLSADEPLKPRLAASIAEVARLKEELARVPAPAATPHSAAPASSAPAVAAPAAPAPAATEEPVRSPEHSLFAAAPDETPSRVWPWALGAALAGLAVGFALGALVLDRHIRRKYGGLRIY